MIRRLKTVLSGITSRIGENHLRHVHNRMALSSLSEHDCPCGLSKDENAEIRLLWGPIGYKGKGEWHRLYKTVNGFDARYVPNDVYGLEILPRLNASKLMPAWDDKSYYKRLFPNIRQPATIAFVIDGCFYDDEYRPSNVDSISRIIVECFDKVIIKPSDGMEGRGVSLIEVAQHDVSSLKGKLLSFGNNYVVQQVIEQHESLAIYNRSSVNPLRVMTLRMNGKIHYLHTTLRFGLPGSCTDMCFIDGKEIAHVCAVSRQGEVSDEWYDMDGNRDLISNLGIGKQTTIPCFESIIDTAVSVHEGLEHFDLIGCDITVDRKGEPILIEYNVYWPGITLPQYCHGPLFGNLTDELLSQLRNKPKKS